MPARALLLTGTVGSGKSTTADRIGKQLRLAGVPHAVIDLDEIRRFWPTPAEDPFGFEVELRNLAPMVAHFRSAGALRLVLAGVCETRQDRERYQVALGMPLVVCRLRAYPEAIRLRLRQRHGDQAELAWHLARVGELEAILDASDVADVEVAGDGKGPDEVAAGVLAAVGWTEATGRP